MAVTSINEVRAALSQIAAVSATTPRFLWALSADEKAVGRAAAQVAQSDDEYCARVLALVPSNYRSEAKTMSGIAIPQDIKDQFEKIKQEALDDGKHLLLEVKDLAVLAEQHGQAAVLTLLDLLRGKVGG